MPTALYSIDVSEEKELSILYISLGFLLIYAMYMCLVYATGAEAAEQRSVIKRPLYREYQKITNVIWMVNLP